MIAPIHTTAPQSNGKCRFQHPHAEPPATAKPAADNPPLSNARARIAEIERLWMQGYTTYQIAEQMGLPPRDVGRNLREIRKRMQRAAERQSQAAFVVAQCAEIGRAAMDAWRHSQGTHQVVTTRQKDGRPDTVTTRTEEKPGNAAFLNAALRATKTLSDLASQLPASSTKSADAARLALSEVLTPKQSSALSPEQREGFAVAFDRWKELFAAVDLAVTANAEAPAAVVAAVEAGSPDFAPSSTAVEAGSPDPAQCSTEGLPFPASENTPEAVSLSGRSSVGDLGGVGRLAPNTEMPSEAAVEPGEAPEPVAACEDPSGGDAAAQGEHVSDQRPTVRRAAAIRHPEWPAESFLTRAWLPPDRRFIPDDGENAACGADFQGVCSANGRK